MEKKMDILISKIHKTRPMWFNEPKVRHRVEQCLPTVTIRTRPTDEFRHVVHGGRYKRHETGITVSTKTLYDFIGIDKDVLSTHLSESGFNNVDEWIAAIKRQHRLEKKTGIGESETFYVVRVTPICKRPGGRL